MRSSDPVRVGLVPYLNVQPLVWAFYQPQFVEELGSDRFSFDSSRPRELASRLYAGEFDVAIVPVFEYFRHDGYTIVPGSAIATRGAVASVMLFSNEPLEQLHTIELDTSSLTSVNLTRVLLAERGFSPAFVDTTEGDTGATLPAGTGRVLIGDPALRQRGNYSVQYDLGEMWRETTGLPFVFAAWIVKPGHKDLPLNDAFFRARQIGQQNIEVIAQEVAPRFGFTPEFALNYYRENLAQDFDKQQQAGLREFGRRLAKYELCSDRALRWHSA